MSFEEIDQILDVADLAHRNQLQLEERIKNPIHRSYQEFLQSDGSVRDCPPFYVIVHSDVIKTDPELDEPTRIKLLKEIQLIEQNFEHTYAGPFELAAGVPSGRPILVCGAYDDICVEQQHDLLIKRGYDAYISQEGTLSFSSEME